jgi:translocation and assembly module TamB
VTDATAKRPRRAWWKYLLVAACAGLLVLAAVLWYTTTDSFQSLVRRRLVAEVERITGGRAEIGSFHTIPFRMQVDVRGITVHGREAAADIPLVHADRLVAQVKVISFLRTEFGFHDVILDHPVIHVVLYPDGTSNFPGLHVSIPSDKSSMEQLFGLSIDRLDVRHGEMLWNDQTVPLDFVVQDAALQMDYSYLRSRYEGKLLLGKIDTRFKDFRPFAWMATAEFNLGTTSAEIKSIKLNSGRSHLDANGRVNDFRHPKVEANYDAYLDLGEAGSIARRHDLREGVVELKGKGDWSLEQFATSGALALRDLGWQDDLVSIKKVSATAEYSASDQEIKVLKLQGSLLEGTFTGDAQIDNWLSNAPVSRSASRAAANDQIAIITATRPSKPQANKNTRPKVPGVETGAVHLRLREVSAKALAASLDTTAHPLRHFRPAGFATGTLDARWKGSARDADVAFLFDLNPPQRSAPGDLPMTARAQGTYRGASEELEINRLNVSTPASRVQASGTLSASSALHFSIVTSNLDELRPVLAALKGPADLPFQVNGNASFNGVVSGTLSNPSVAGTLAAQDFEFTLPATSRTPVRQVQWDSLSTSVQMSSKGMILRSGTLSRDDTSAEFEVSATLEHWAFTPSDPFTARINLHHVDVASTAALTGYDYPLTGTADLFLQVSGTRSNPQAQGQIHAKGASAYGETISQFDADLRVHDGETSLANIHLFHDDSIITGSAAYNPSGRTLRLDLSGNNFDLSRIRQIHLERLAVEGRGAFTLRGSGSVDAPILEAKVHLADLALDREPVGAFDLEASASNHQLHVTGHSEFAHGNLLFESNADMRGDYPATATFHMDHLDLDPLWRSYLQGDLTGHSSVAGTLTMKGPLRDPRQWTLDGSLTDVSLDVEHAKLQNQDPVRFTYAQQSLNIQQLHMTGEGTDLTAHGSAHFGGSRELDLTSEGHVDLKLLNSFYTDMTASGIMTMNVTVGGSIDDPLPQGKLQLANGYVSYAGLPSGLSEMNGSLIFTRDRIHIEKLTARTGGGTLDLKGDATTYDRELSFNLSAVGKEVRLRYPPGVSSTADAELHWVGTRSASTVSGDILVTKLAVTPNFDFSSYLERSRQIGAITPANSPLYNVKLDIHVQTAPELQMKTAVARLSGDADLRLRGSVARPTVLGRADVLEGEATFNGTKFRLERGDITFANPVTIEPLVNLQASTHVRNYDLDITVTGTPDRLAVNYRSEPPLPKSDIIALLALGRTSEESEQLQQQSGQSAFNDEATAMIINQAINATVSSRMQKLFGVSRIKIDPQGLTTETNPAARGPQVTIEQQFANNISLTYSTNVSQSSQQIIQGEYYFTRNISAVGTRDQNGVVSFDIRIRRQKK